MNISIISLFLTFSVCVTFLLNYYNNGIQYAPEYASTFLLACLSFCHGKEILKNNLFFMLKSRIIYFFEILNCLALIYWSFSLLYIKESFISYFSLSIAIISIFVSTRKSFKKDEFDYIFVTDRNFESWSTFYCKNLTSLNNRAILVLDAATPNHVINFFQGKNSDNGVSYSYIHYTTDLDLFEKLIDEPNTALRYSDDGMVSSVVCFSSNQFISLYYRLVNSHFVFKNYISGEIKRNVIVYIDSINELRLVYLCILRTLDHGQDIAEITKSLTSASFEFRAGDFAFSIKLLINVNRPESEFVPLTKAIKF